MGHNILQKTGWFAGLVLLQALILNNINVLGYATPFLYVYFILKLDSGTSRNGLLLWGFLLGLCVDIFSNTPGMNATATVLLAFVRPFYLRIFTPRDIQENFVPSGKQLSMPAYAKYLLISIATHHLVLFALMFFSFADMETLSIKIAASTLLTFICVLATDKLRL